MTINKKIETKLFSMSASEVFEVMRALNNDEREEAFLLMEIATDIYMTKTSEETFCKAMDILEKEMNY